MKTIKLWISVIAVITLSGCSAVSTAMKKQDLVIESQLSHSVVLEPVAPSERIVYVRVRDVSGNNMRAGMLGALTQNLQQEGFVITRNPKEANLMLDATVMKADKTTAAEASRALSSGYKGGAEGAVLAGSIAAISGGSGRTTGAVALGGAALGFLADQLVEDVYYTFVLDVQLRERPLDGDIVLNEKDNRTSQGQASVGRTTNNKSVSTVTRGDNYNWLIYETRIVTTANKMNLDINEAIPAVQKRTASSLSALML
ncbi:complement resistance protein TraT [Shewanella submarina]|uniref:Complement resistance protein TraT n=1 Tax=Shewanella submarina TaxID=2016376 RepID=A0ABV7GGB7_9GAMM|nr:complement resistance protein TraT [Shewanella submarina]MCL1039460.1 complement resistance protein TraT [Shewanella submarina]